MLGEMPLRPVPTCPTARPVPGRTTEADVRKALKCGVIFVSKRGWSEELRDFFDLWLDFWLLGFCDQTTLVIQDAA